MASTSVVWVEGVIPVTRARLRRLSGPAAADDAAEVMLAVPGAVFGDRFQRVVDDSFPVEPGDVFWLMLDATSEAGLYNVAWGFGVGVYRRVESDRGPLIADPTGRFVTAVDCGRRLPTKAILPPPVSEVDGADGPAELLPGFVETDAPQERAMSWDAALGALSACGGGR